LHWILTARVFTAQEALHDGVAMEVCTLNELHARAQALAEEILANAPIAVRQAKKAVRLGMGTSLQNALEIENECYNDVIPTEDRLEALKAFSEKRKPNWSNR
ncbi:MAG TPA: enoyl-CoA hydratase-related protein, partial [bacterium]|nr:enoyl-CoA hydratase-related protein [bacterium]